MNFADLKEKILRKRPVCESCHRNRATQLHHCLVHDMKKYHDLLTVEENLMPICEECHTSLSQKANSYEVRRAFAYKQVVEYNYDIGKWYRELPLVFKEQWLLDYERSRDEH